MIKHMALSYVRMVSNISCKLDQFTWVAIKSTTIADGVNFMLGQYFKKIGFCSVITHLVNFPVNLADCGI